MSRRPQDLLEFLRSQKEEAEARVQTAPAPEPPRRTGVPTPGSRLMVFRTTQVAVAGAAAGLLVILAFVLGGTLGGTAPPAESGPAYVIRAATFPNTAAGQQKAKLLAGDLDDAGFKPVRLYEIKARRHLVVTVGDWDRNPAAAQLLRRRVRDFGPAGEKPLQGADFWKPPR